MSMIPEEHDFIAEEAAERAPKRLSKCPAERLADCREAPVAIDESAERAKFEAIITADALESGNDEPSLRMHDFEGNQVYVNCHIQNCWYGWLACAKSRTEGE